MGTWFYATRGYGVVADPIAIEAMFQEAGISAEDAVLIVPELPFQGEGSRVHRVQLASGDVLASSELRTSTSCARARDVHWTGGAVCILPRTGAGAEQFPGELLLINGNPELRALVVLGPGDQIETRTVHRKRRPAEHSIQLQSRGAALEIRSTDGDATVCFNPGATASKPDASVAATK